MTRRPVAVLFALFAVSGFTGLIYESLWSHYLKLFLGHAAFAQSFVLIVFMGGMALGAWLASRFSARCDNLLAAYGRIEALIGLIALVFHEVFVGLTDASLATLIPALGNPTAVEIYKLALCALLLLPQTILLGMSFPLMSGAVIRRSPADADGRPLSGHHLAMLYFTNSIGAAAGALAAAFWLLGAFGMPGTMRLAGAANLLLAALVLWLARTAEPASQFTERRAQSATPTPAPALPPVQLFLCAAFVTGMASFIYEIAWVRMLSLVLGSSFQAFELMLSAFITGLALGGLWIRKRIDRIADPVRFAGSVQLAMGLAALATILVYDSAFDWMAWLFSVLKRGDLAYPLFNLGSHAIAFAIMLPATFLAGMTLPLFTHVLLRGGYGERAIGQVYAANTLGAIAGVLVAVHLLLPFTGLKLSLIVGAALDMLLGMLLLLRSAVPRRRRLSFAAALAAVLAIAAVSRAAALDPVRLSSGVFRYGELETGPVDIAYYRDGKTASVSLRVRDLSISIATNGKIDAAIELDAMRPPKPDESTMTLLAAIPLLLKPDAKAIANIGFGSGLSAEVALSHSAVESIDTIEIEPAMVEAARGFFPRVQRVFDDPRSHIHIEDAKTFFARHQKRYDLILSEPSNPWVNGVASLFSREFYRDVRRYLAPGGQFVQWVQIYELEDRLLGSVLAALGEHFADYSVYETAPGDLMIVATPTGTIAPLGPIPVAEQRFAALLKRVGVTGLRNLEVRRVGTRRSLAPLLAALGAPANSDFYPLLQLEATRARFANKSATGILALMNAPLPVHEMLAEPQAPFLETIVPLALSDRLLRQNQALDAHRILTSASAQPLAALNPDARLPLTVLKSGRPLCRATVEPALLEHLHAIAELTLAHLGKGRRHELWVKAKWLGCAPARTAPAARARLGLYRSIAERDADRMFTLGSAVLEDRDAQQSASWRRFALLTAMLGAHAGGHPEQARKLWSAHAPVLYPDGRIEPYIAYLANWGR